MEKIFYKFPQRKRFYPHEKKQVEFVVSRLHIFQMTALLNEFSSVIRHTGINVSDEKFSLF